MSSTICHTSRISIPHSWLSFSETRLSTKALLSALSQSHAPPPNCITFISQSSQAYKQQDRFTTEKNTGETERTVKTNRNHKTITSKPSVPSRQRTDIGRSYGSDRRFQTTPAVQLPDSDWSKAENNNVNRLLHDSLQLVPKLTPIPLPGGNVLLGRSQEELEELMMALGEQKYRGRQLHQFLYKNQGKDYNELQLLPKKIRAELAERNFVVGRPPVHHVAASVDGTAKILLRLDDNRLVEAVGIPSELERGVNRLTACVSSQVGCPLRCSFCATGKGGFARSLAPHEIVAQVLALEELFGHRVSNVVFMGMGEPLLNSKAVTAALTCMNKDLGIGARMITISTVGVPNTIRRLAGLKLQSTLAVSLHAPNQRLREQLIPSAKAYPLEALMADCQMYFQTTGRRVSFEYTVLAGVNDQLHHANELADLLHEWQCGNHVNLIPYNPITDSDFRRPDRAHVTAFMEALKKRKITVTVRQTRGMDANAACGQLRNDFQKTPLAEAVEVAV